MMPSSSLLHIYEQEEIPTINSEYLNYKLNRGHKYGTTAGTVDVIRRGKKGKHLNTLDR
jgi:hypothetical protein